MSKINAKLINIILLIATVYAGGIRVLFEYFEMGNNVILILTQCIGIIAILAAAYFIIKKHDFNERGYYIFGTPQKDIIACIIEFIIIFGLIGYAAIKEMISSGTAVWESIMLVAFFMILFYGIEKKKLRDDIIAEIQEEQRREMEAENNKDE